jgi:hypothetical protein
LRLPSVARKELLFSFELSLHIIGLHTSSIIGHHIGTNYD